jgi:hypothetical protein
MPSLAQYNKTPLFANEEASGIIVCKDNRYQLGTSEDKMHMLQQPRCKTITILHIPQHKPDAYIQNICSSISSTMPHMLHLEICLPVGSDAIRNMIPFKTMVISLHMLKSLHLVNLPLLVLRSGTRDAVEIV